LKYKKERDFFNVIRNIYKKPAANFKLNENVEVFPLRSRASQECSLSPLIFNILVEVLVS
jgi:hypothetical protein